MKELDRLKDFIVTYYSINSCYPSPKDILDRIELIKSGRPEATMPEHLYNQAKVIIDGAGIDISKALFVYPSEECLRLVYQHDVPLEIKYLENFTRDDALTIQDLWRRL